MYLPGENDRLIVLDGFPPMESGSPLPNVRAHDGVVVVDYFTHQFGVDTNTRARVVFRHVRAHYLGWPNDEALSAHPLYGRGLRPYDAFEVIDSSWKATIIAANRAHPLHRDEHFAADRHFIMTFHDETFECIARTVEVETLTQDQG